MKLTFISVDNFLKIINQMEHGSFQLKLFGVSSSILLAEVDKKLENLSSGDSNENAAKKIGFINKTIAFHVCFKVRCTFLCKTTTLNDQIHGFVENLNA